MAQITWYDRQQPGVVFGIVVVVVVAALLYCVFNIGVVSWCKMPVLCAEPQDVQLVKG